MNHQSPRTDSINEIKGKLEFHDNIASLGKRKRDKIVISELSRYGDSKWDLSKENPSVKTSKAVIDFRKIVPNYDQKNNKILDTVKEFAYSMLTNPPTTTPKWKTFCSSSGKGLPSLISYMIDNHIEKFSDITEHDMSDFMKRLSRKPKKNGSKVTNRTLSSRVGILDWFYEQSHKIKNGLKVWPFQGSPSKGVWCNENADTVIARSENRTIEISDKVAVQLLKKAMQDINLYKKMEAINKLREEYVMDNNTVNYHKLKETGFKWEDHGLKSGHEIKNIEARIIASGYIIIALLTGMRSHEICLILANPEENWEEREIEISKEIKKVYFVKSKTEKYEDSPTSYLWQTVPFVKKAIDALNTALYWRRRNSNSPYLICGLNKLGDPYTHTNINVNLRFFQDFHKIIIDKNNYNLSTHKFRKKFSRIIIRQGLGLKELQDQLKHYDINVTKVYGDMNIYTELQQEKFNLSSELYDELLGSQRPIIGGGAQEVAHLRSQFIGMTRSDRKKFLSELPNKATIDQVGDGLCMYRPAKALCGGDSRNCHPAECGNSAIYADNLKKTLLWRLSENERLMKCFARQPLKRAHLSAKKSEINSLLSQIELIEVKNEEK